MHLLIPLACSDAPGCAAQLPALRLPRLHALLQRMLPVDDDWGPPDSLTPPHERARARLLGLPALPDGCLPWAALEARALGLGGDDDAWAWISPVHWEVGAQSIHMGDPHALAMGEAESRALMAAMAVYFAEDGLALHYAEPHRWLCRSPLFQGLPTAALDRAIGRDLQPLMPTLPSLRRLQNEMQMLLYTHPVNDARATAGKTSINSFWVSGTGQAPAGPLAAAVPPVTVADGLQGPAQQGDWAAWAQAWEQLDARFCGQLLERLDQEPDSRLVLCGERGALHFGLARASWWNRLRRRWTPPTLASLQERL